MSMTKEEHDQQQRSQAFQFAHVRLQQGASIDEVLAEAEKILHFIQKGVRIAVPQPGDATKEP